MSVVISPNSIAFEEPEDGSAFIQPLSFSNLHDTTIAFKVKTTAPKRYCVRPNLGFIPPKQTKEVKVIFQPRKTSDERNPGKVNRDKFLVESLVIPEEMRGSLDNDEGKISFDQWDEAAQKVTKEKISHYKLKCDFTETAAIISTTDGGSGSGSGGGKGTSVVSENVDVDVATPAVTELRNRRNVGVDSMSREDLQDRCAELEAAHSEIVTQLRKTKELLARSATSKGRQGSGSYTLIHLLVIALIFLVMGIGIGKSM